MVEELKIYSSQDLEDLDLLMHELSETSFCDKTILDNVMNDVNSHVLVIRDGGHIIATGTLCLLHTPEFSIGHIESVVVSSIYRGKGYGKELMNSIIDLAKGLNVLHLHLTSNSKREVANSLYNSMGFERYDTNCYKLNF